ncbi:olfactory receptor 5V1-like [Mantella aurantiaca]
MCEVNQTEEAGFLLLGFQNLNKFKILLFIVFLISYIVILSGNLNIIVLISIDNHLKIPMFYFVKHLAIADLMITTTIVPMMLEIMIKDTITISVTACFIQLHCSFIFGFVQCFLIVIMSYDRYLAISVIVPFVFIIVTYVLIALTILPISSSNGRRKAFSTCSSHLATVCTYYGSKLSLLPKRGQFMPSKAKDQETHY